MTFDDVAGIDEAERELAEIVDFLKRPERYTKLGARIPRGVLLYGPPGTGKTLLARAVAGEADAAFFSHVGVGVRRGDRRHGRLARARPVQAGQGGRAGDRLHRRARRDRPLAFGHVGGLSGGNDEREQTLNQILTEMDGFEPGTNVIVLGATNRPEVLDQALLRPGPLRPPDRRAAARQAPAALEILRSTRARCRSPATSTSSRSPRRRRARPAPTWR